MKIEKITINKSKLDANFKLYFFLKELNGAIKLSDSQINSFIEAYFANKNLAPKKIISIFSNIIEKLSDTKKEGLNALIYQINNDTDFHTLLFSLKLIQIKPLLLAEAKLGEVAGLASLQKMNQLSIAYDTISKGKPYFTRVNGALLSLLFFSKLDERDSGFISQSTEDYLNSLFKEYNYLKNKGLEPNQMFMLMFSESINQSILSDAGSSYEDRIYNILIAIGIKPDSIRKTHDKNDSSTEFDFFFKLSGKTFGIGAKRTLRERYKQFIKTAQMSELDVMIQITLGLDLTEEKALSIRKHHVFLFVADEIFASREYLRKIHGIYPASDLNIRVLNKLASRHA